MMRWCREVLAAVFGLRKTAWKKDLAKATQLWYRYHESWHHGNGVARLQGAKRDTSLRNHCPSLQREGFFYAFKAMNSLIFLDRAAVGDGNLRRWPTGGEPNVA